MDKKLNFREYIYLASMLFGLFFGAGNLIFPVFMGQLAGSNIWFSILGFLITGVGLPLLGIVAMGISRSSGLYDLASRVNPLYSLFFTCALYLTIGPFFAIPRTATVSFEVGIAPLIPESQTSLWLGIFSFLFFLCVLLFSLKPSNILVYVGKILNPIFLLFLSILIIASIINPMGSLSDFPATGAYEYNSFFQGFIEGYNTMDALASLAFGIVVINAIKNLGVKDPKSIALSTIKSGILSTSLMALIYAFLAIIGAQSLGITSISANGGQALAIVSEHYFGRAGALLLAATITVACLKTAVGLITSCSETFASIFKNSLSYRSYAILFCSISFGIANVGLNNIISFSIPALMFLYPLAIVLILLSLFHGAFKGDRRVYKIVTAFTLPAAIMDLIGALPEGLVGVLNLSLIIDWSKTYIPFYHIGMGWLVPSLVGLIIALLVSKINPNYQLDN
ncbi:MAG: branched-chain amino acid transport system II carrier protein [Tissierellia bacterium]|nr:branched-chain amino acid transport system II carrier protein [Tissierellia bacterium]